MIVDEGLPAARVSVLPIKDKLALIQNSIKRHGRIIQRFGEATPEEYIEMLRTGLDGGTPSAEDYQKLAKACRNSMYVLRYARGDLRGCMHRRSACTILHSSMAFESKAVCGACTVWGCTCRVTPETSYLLQHCPAGSLLVDCLAAHIAARVSTRMQQVGGLPWPRCACAHPPGGEA